MKSKMYKDTKTWNPAVGCQYGCIYCRYSFQSVIAHFNKLSGRNCKGCQHYSPHEHPERLERIPTSYKNIFMFGNGDITFYRKEFVIQALAAINRILFKHPHITLYLQSKNPITFNKYLPYLNEERTVLLTTLETNRDINYSLFSKAPPPTQRALDFYNMPFKRKIITVEPVMKFDLHKFSAIICRINPEQVYLGYNSKPDKIRLPEPNLIEFNQLWLNLKSKGIPIVIKSQR